MNENLKNVLNILKNTKISVNEGNLTISLNLSRINSVYSITDPKGKEHKITKINYSEDVVNEYSSEHNQCDPVHRSFINNYNVYDEEWFDYDERGSEIYCMSTSDGTEEWYNKDGYPTHYKELDTGYEEWKEYDENGNCIYSKDSKGREITYEYDCEGYLIHKKINNGEEYWYKRDVNGKMICKKDHTGKEEYFE